MSICETCYGKGYTGLKKHESICGLPTDKPCADCGGTGQAGVIVSASPFIIDCDAVPYVPDGWKIRPEDQPPSALGGRFSWDSDRIGLFLSSPQKFGYPIGGLDLLNVLKGQPVLKANVLDWVLVNTGCVPPYWTDRSVFFWGTLCRDLGGNLCVPYRNRNGIRDFRRLYSGWHDRDPAAVLEP